MNPCFSSWLAWNLNIMIYILVFSVETQRAWKVYAATPLFKSQLDHSDSYIHICSCLQCPQLHAFYSQISHPPFSAHCFFKCLLQRIISSTVLASALNNQLTPWILEALWLHIDICRSHFLSCTSYWLWKPHTKAHSTLLTLLGGSVSKLWIFLYFVQKQEVYSRPWHGLSSTEFQFW